MNIPTFSIFSAISEVFVTIGVLYAIITTLRGKPFPKVALGIVLAFELCVNVVYMAGRASQADKSAEISHGMKLFYAFHGTLSLLMFVTLAAVYLLSLWDESSGRQTWFARHRTGSYVMIFFWMVSVISGEVIFYLAHLA
ncbi:MAG: hypothetical protein IPG45_00970 [Deltaproteobacteria bacterium]|nr:hypothetical protein [Deltaproteobacteria bacterium]